MDSASDAATDDDSSAPQKHVIGRGGVNNFKIGRYVTCNHIFCKILDPKWVPMQLGSR